MVINGWCILLCISALSHHLVYKFLLRTREMYRLPTIARSSAAAANRLMNPIALSVQSNALRNYAKVVSNLLKHVLYEIDT